MLAGLLAAVLTIDAGTPVPVVLDVHHAALWLSTDADGGFSDAPRLVRGGIWVDDDTAVLLGKSAARGTAERKVTPDADVGTVTAVALVMFGVGLLVGGTVVAGLALAKKF